MTSQGGLCLVFINWPGKAADVLLRHLDEVDGHVDQRSGREGLKLAVQNSLFVAT